MGADEAISAFFWSKEYNYIYTGFILLIIILTMMMSMIAPLPKVICYFKFMMTFLACFCSMFLIFVFYSIGSYGVTPYKRIYNESIDTWEETNEKYVSITNIALLVVMFAFIMPMVLRPIDTF